MGSLAHRPQTVGRGCDYLNVVLGVSCHPFLGFFFLYYMYYMVAAWVHRPRSAGTFAGRKSSEALHQLGVDHNFSNSG